MGGGGAGRGTRARSAGLGFPPPTCLAPLCGRSALRASPRWGEARSRALAPSGMFFCRNRLKGVAGLQGHYDDAGRFYCQRAMR